MGFVGFRYPSSPGPRPPSPVAALVVQALAGPPCPVAVLSGEALPPPPDPACFPGLLVLPPPPPSAGGVLASPTPTSLDSIIHARKQTHPPSYSLVHQRQTRAYRPDIFKSWTSTMHWSNLTAIPRKLKENCLLLHHPHQMI
ncbi:hypothetical protein SETIT_9G263500v2 [Setaria italica]|uniref:Uncharacterized protein n=1 Tax=Setaria italica TaxID=4555 RepID=A0A368SL04_SETIT|nr:leucine-rich repeat extensin-like protein 1 [Setaria italica]RCV43034.1 hypothetical protein SETIT_9G263500v2 [Setaria italica]